MITKFIIFGDSHFSKSLNKSHPKKDSISSWYNTQEQIVRDIFSYAEKYSVGTIFFNGDLFDAKNHLPQDLYNAVWELFKNYSKDFEIIFNTGNHDILTYNRESSLKPFSDIVTVVDKPRDFEINDTIVRVIPFGMVDRNLKVPEGYSKTILLTHEDISGLTYGPNDYQSSNRLKPQIFSDWSIVYNGHIHKPQVYNNITNIGSIMPIDWGEVSDTKQFVFYNDGKITSIPTKHPEFIEFDNLLDVKDINDYNFYRINISSEELSDPIFKKWNVTPNITKKRKRIKRLKETNNTTDEIKEYVDLQDVGTLDKDKLVQIGKELIGEE